MVKVFHVKDVLGDVVGALADDGICDGVIGDVDNGGIDGDVRGVGSEEIEVVEVGVIFVGAAETDDDERDQRHDGRGHGEEDACEAAGFTHNGGTVWIEMMDSDGVPYRLLW